MRNWKIWTAFLSVFTAGILVGVLGTGLMLPHFLAPPRNPVKFHEQMRQRIMEDIRTEVRPAPENLPAIEKAVVQTLRELAGIRKETHPRIIGAFTKGAERIKQHLTPEQSERFDAMIQERRRGKFGMFRLPPPPPPI